MSKGDLVALNHSLALVLWAKDRHGEDDVAVFPGILAKRGGAYFLRRPNGKDPEIRSEWLPRIKAVPDELRETLADCEFQLSLTVGDAEGEAGPFEKFGLRWPD